MTRRHRDFQRIYDEFQHYYKQPSRADREYYDWLRALNLDEAHEYGHCRESFTWAKDMLQPLREDRDHKYYQILLGFPLKSMNGNVYKERDLVAAALSLKGKHPSLNHKDEFWFNEHNRHGTLTIVDGKYEDGAIETILQVPKTAVCPICDGKPMTELIDAKRIVNVSLEGDCAGGLCPTGECEGFYFTDPPFTLLTTDVLPGIPLARIKPLESIMVEALQGSTGKPKTVKIKATIKEDTPTLVQPPVNVNTGSLTDPDFKGTIGTPITTDDGLHAQTMSSGNTTVEVGTSPASRVFTSGLPSPSASVPEHAPSDPTGPVEHVQEPFADYDSFDDCVAKNQDKDDPAAYCARIQQQTEAADDADDVIAPGSRYCDDHPDDPRCVAHKTAIHSESTPPNYAGDAPSTGSDTRQPKPDDDRGGPTRTTPPHGDLPHTRFGSPVKAKVVTGTSPVGPGRVVTGTSPVGESLPSLEERRARIKAEMHAKSSEEQAVVWEQKHNEVYEKHAALNERYLELNRVYEAVKADAERERGQHSQRLENAIVKMEQAISDYNAVCGAKAKLERQLSDLTTSYTDVNEKYQKTLAQNLDLAKKVTAANEDYIGIAKKLEQTDDALKRARNEAKKIIRIQA